MRTLQTIIAATLATLIQDQKQFTAFDVTLLVRASGEQVRHSQVKSIVHDLMSREGSYSKTFNTFGVVAFPAWVYHPVSANASAYSATAIRDELANKSAAVNFNAVRPVGQPISKPSGKQVEVGTGNRLRVPAESVRKLGLKAGDKGYVSVDNGKIIVTAAQPVGKTAKAITVDQYDNLLFRSPLGVTSDLFEVSETATMVTLVAV
jgi:hypothetical protein